MNDGSPPLPKKPKIEIIDEQEERSKNGGGNQDEEEEARQEQEEALLALIEHRTKEVQHLRRRITYYKSQLDQAEKRLEETHSKLARTRGRESTTRTKTSAGNGINDVKVEKTSPIRPAQFFVGSSQNLIQNKPHSSPGQISIGSSQNLIQSKPHSSPAQISVGSSQNLSQNKPYSSQEDGKPFRNSEGPDRGSATSLKLKYSSQSLPQSKPQLVIPAVEPNVSQPMRIKEGGASVSSGSGARPNISIPAPAPAPAHSHVDGIVKLKVDKSQRVSPEQEDNGSQSKGTKKSLVLKEHKELIRLVCNSSSPNIIRCHTGSLISSQHKRKLRSLVLCPTNDQLFVTSALDGFINLWQVQGRGSSANLLSSSDCASAKQRRWPEDTAWHPHGNSLFSVYSADGGDSQISILNLNKTKERVNFLEEKPHVKGIINNIVFMPWEDSCFVTGGSDHAVILWTEKDGEDSWKPKPLHRSFHSSAVYGVAGMQQKKIVLSAGADKRIIGFDLNSGRADYKHQIESKCMSVLPNPCDFNLFMVQTGTPERQLRLFDIRLRHTEIHAFGWKQENSESQSALIDQAWSPDGLYITSGSADPVIHIFDIRYNAHKPSQSIKAHHRRVFKAVWHHALPIMISISSDLNIGLHKII